ncbi:MAG: nitroreductase [Nitrososphaerales archaeon]|jgi:nitroreductase
MNEVIEAIRSRRTIKKMDPVRSPTREAVEAVLEAAVWAPNHHLTEPWRFVVVSGKGRERLGAALADACAASPVGRSSPERVEIERRKPLDAPYIVALICRPSAEARIAPQEELVAAGAALQNALLAAHSLGLASFVRTGELAYSGEVRRLFGMRQEELMVGMVYLGYAVNPAPPGRRSPASGRVTWMDA